MMKNIVIYFEDGGIEDCIEFTDSREFKKWVIDSFDNPNLIITKVE